MQDKKRNIVFHIDVDSPPKLLDFYQIKNIKSDQFDLESFYQTSFSRIFDFFDKCDITASFFLVGKELENSKIIQNIVQKAHSLGHKIENHSYTHPFGLATLSDEEITSEITRCSEIIYKITGRYPTGFRSPGYSIDTRIINILRNNGFKYDSSGFWSIMNTILAYGHEYLFKNGLKNEGFGYVTRKLPHEAYCPDKNNWQIISKNTDDFIEMPLPRTKLFGLPFYNNINLWAPELYSKFIAGTIQRKNLIYLFHAIEFVDLSDNIPIELASHPNLKIPVKEKMLRSEKIVRSLLKRYEH